jgi:quercetin dioxygenase-like cupin family protein
MRYIRSIGLVVWLAALLVAAGRVVAPVHAQAPAPTVAAQAEFPITVADGDAALMNLIIDFAPNAGAPDHTHGGPVTALVLDGEITVRESGTTKPYRSGTFWTEIPGHVHNTVNLSGSPARISVVGLLPKGGRFTIPEAQSSYTPAQPNVITIQTQFPLGVAAGEATLVNVIIDFAPGAATPQHVHGGPVLATVLSGAVTVHNPGETHVYRAGESWTEFPNTPHHAVNEGAEVARVSVAAILPRGAALTTPVSQAPAALPRTGAADDGMLLWLLLASGTALGVGAGVRLCLLRRQS